MFNVLYLAMSECSDEGRHRESGNRGRHVGETHENPRVVARDVVVVGEDSGEHGAVEERGDDHETDDDDSVASAQTHADEANGRHERGDRHRQFPGDGRRNPTLAAGPVQSVAVEDREQPIAEEWQTRQSGVLLDVESQACPHEQGQLHEQHVPAKVVEGANNVHYNVCVSINERNVCYYTYCAMTMAQTGPELKILPQGTGGGLLF